MTYANEWATAVDRSKRHGLEVPRYELQFAHRHLNDERLAEFPHIVQRGLGDLEYPDVVAQCLAIHYRLVPVLQSWLGCPVLYTLGWVDDGTERGMFRFDDDDVARMLKNKHHGATSNIHAWLTLPSMEVIDVSLATTIAVVQDLPEGRGAVIAKHADELRGMAYKPMLVGTDFLPKSGLLRTWDFHTVD